MSYSKKLEKLGGGGSTFPQAKKEGKVSAKNMEEKENSDRTKSTSNFVLRKFRRK